MNDFAAKYEPTSDEKTMATLAQVLQLVGWWIAPLIIYLIRRESKFVAFHALQALLWQILLMIFWFGTMIVWFTVIFATMFAHAGKAAVNNLPPLGFFLGFIGIWLGVMGITGLNLFVGIYYGIKAGRGEWAAYPIIGRVALRIVGA
jgi:uncharacterized Tic20 family protein